MAEKDKTRRIGEAFDKIMNELEELRALLVGGASTPRQGGRLAKKNALTTRELAERLGVSLECARRGWPKWAANDGLRFYRVGGAANTNASLRFPVDSVRAMEKRWEENCCGPEPKGAR